MGSRTRGPIAFFIREQGGNMPAIVQDNSLFEIDRELDFLLDEIQEQAESDDTDEVSSELMQKFQQFCEAYNDKVDRIGHFLSVMEARAAYCRGQANRLTDRARSAENKVDRTKNMVLYYLKSRELRKIEGKEFTLRLQKNSQDSLVVLDEPQIPLLFRDIEAKIPGNLWEVLLAYLPDEARRELNACIRQMKPSADAIKRAAAVQEEVPGAAIRRGVHLRVA
jgi:Siphovirus Gp157